MSIVLAGGAVRVATWRSCAHIVPRLDGTVVRHPARVRLWWSWRCSSSPWLWGAPVPVSVPGNWSEPMLGGNWSEPMLGGNWSEPYWSETAGIWSGSGDAGGLMSPIVPIEATAWASVWPKPPDIFGASSWFGGDWQWAPWPMMPAPSVDDWSARPIQAFHWPETDENFGGTWFGKLAAGQAADAK